MKKIRDDKSLVGLAGEFHVLAQLAERGIVGALTLGHTKGVDILAHNPRTGTVRKVEVKTTRDKPAAARHWHSGDAYSWTMSDKHEALADPNLLFCFVHLTGPLSRPIIFVVPAPEVAAYVKWEHRRWLEATGRLLRTENKMRRFRIETADPRGYGDNWGLFD